MRKLDIADLATRVSMHTLSLPTGECEVAVKHDEDTSMLYGGNKIRKLEYLFGRALERNADRVATYGAVGSNHALATAMHAAKIGLECTCILAHQTKTPKIPYTLNMHHKVGTEIIPWHREDHLTLYRQHLQGRNAFVIPLGGTNVRGSIGYVDAGFELARQISDGQLSTPARIYIACGTTGSAAGLVAGLAAAGLKTELHAVQVSSPPFATEEKLRKLTDRTIYAMKRLDPKFEAPGWSDNLVWRGEFLAGGYAKVDEPTNGAVDIARDQLGLKLETTYTGKALAAMLHDLRSPDYDGGLYIYWNTANAAELPVTAEMPHKLGNIPEEFRRYYEP